MLLIIFSAQVVPFGGTPVIIFEVTSRETVEEIPRTVIAKSPGQTPEWAPRGVYRETSTGIPEGSPEGTSLGISAWTLGAYLRKKT